MEKLPQKFPEYSIMHRTLSNQIEKLKQQRENAHESKIEEIELQIKLYKSEITKIEEIFPSNYFEKTD